MDCKLQDTWPILLILEKDTIRKGQEQERLRTEAVVVRQNSPQAVRSFGFAQDKLSSAQVLRRNLPARRINLH